MRVKVLKVMDSDGSHIATADAFEGSVHVYVTRLMDGFGKHPLNYDEDIHDGFEDAARITASQLRKLATDSVLDMYETLTESDIRFGRATVRNAERYFSV